MRRARLRVTLGTDNRLVSRTTVTGEVCKAVETFDLTPRELKGVLIYGFKRCFFPSSYPRKREYVRAVLNRMEAVMAQHGIELRPGEPDRAPKPAREETAPPARETGAAGVRGRRARK